MLGQKLAQYEILDLLGKGGMGEVYRARDTVLKRDVALKILPPEFSRDPERIARFQREAEVLASLNHPNIAHIYGFVEQDDTRAIAMEFVEGASPSGPMDFDDAWKLMLQVAAGLEYAHERRVVHRDLKPANLKVTPEGHVKILDFGLAKALTGEPRRTDLGQDSPTLTIGATQTGVIVGTAAYMAPEQVKGKDADRRADIWSFGVVLYELLTGEGPFQGADSTEECRAVCGRQWLPIHEVFRRSDEVPLQFRPRRLNRWTSAEGLHICGHRVELRIVQPHCRHQAFGFEIVGILDPAPKIL
jgi:serine/threonine-protein kinase